MAITSRCRYHWGVAFDAEMLALIYVMIRARPTWIVALKSGWKGAFSSDAHAECRLFDFDITDDGSDNYILAYKSVDGDYSADTWHPTLDEAYSAAKETFGVDRGEWGPPISDVPPEAVVPRSPHSTIKQLIDVLANARTRKHMYFSPVTPQAVENWLSGLHAGCALAGIWWSPEARQPALERRALEFLASFETAQLAARGLTPPEIVDELLAIEIEMWQHIESDGLPEAGGGAPPFGSVSPV